MQKTKIMASDPITPFQIDGERVETVTDFIFWGSKITADGDCSCRGPAPADPGYLKWGRHRRPI